MQPVRIEIRVVREGGDKISKKIYKNSLTN